MFTSDNSCCKSDSNLSCCFDSNSVVACGSCFWYGFWLTASKGSSYGTTPVNSNWLLLICPCLLLFKTIEKKFACKWQIIWSSESSFEPFLHKLTYQFQVIPTTTSTTCCWFFVCSKSFTHNLLLPICPSLLLLFKKIKNYFACEWRLIVSTGMLYCFNGIK